MSEGNARTVSPQETLEADSPSPVNVGTKATSQRTKDFGFLPILPHLRYYENRPQKFGIVLQLTFVAATTFSE
jgi:hypothetical protein